MALSTPYTYSDPESTLRITDGELAVADDVNNVWLETDQKLADVSSDMIATDAKAGLAEKWAVETAGTLPDAGTPDEYSAKANANESMEWAISDDGLISKADGTIVSEKSSKTYAAESSSSATASASSANFVGSWSDQTGSHLVPTSTYHNNSYWNLVNDVLDITLSEPSVSSDWVVLNTAQVDSIVGTSNEIDIDNTDPANPVASISSSFLTELPKVAEIVTGNLQGLEYNYNSIDTISISKGNCYDSLGLTVLVLNADTTATIPAPVLNTIYNVFLTDAGDIQFDTDVDGVTLLAGSVNQLRWIGFVLTDGAGDIIEFRLSGNLLSFVKISEAIIGTATTSYTLFSAAVLVPITRIVSVGLSPTNNYVTFISYNGVDDAFGMAVDGSVAGALGSTTDIDISNGVYVKVTSGSNAISLINARLKR